MRINTIKTSQTAVPNEFVDELMAKMNGEYVKVYLYILRHAGEDVAEESIADALELTCRDVKRAIDYLRKNRALGEVQEESGNAAVQSSISKLQDNDDFSALLHELQCYQGKTFSAADAEIIAYMYDGMNMPSEMIEYLFEIGKLKKKTSLRYLEKIAQDWHSRGIKTVEDAKKDGDVFAEELNSVKQYMGITSRDLAKSEMEIILRWLREYKMPRELIEEACSRTINNTGKASFSYADSIIQAWKEKKVRSKDQLAQLDSEHKKTQKKAHKASSGKDNRFHNFNERKESLDKDILKKFDDLVK